MGILHLTQLVNENSSTLREDVNIKNAKFKNVVIDGHSFFKTLLNKSSSFHYGGNYSDMYKMFSEPLKGIKECNVQMFVIFDGGCNIDKKLHTWVKRRNDEIELINQFFKDLKLANDLNVATKGFLTNKGLPPNLPFAKSVFVQVLEDLDIRYVVSESEADVIIAAIANIEKSYVVTQDSDFFIFDIPRGVISAKDFSELTKRKSKCGVYHRIKLMKLLHREDNLSEDNLSYLPVIFGCDYSNQNLLEDITKRLPLYTGKNSQTQYLKNLRYIFSLQKKELLQKVTEGKQELLDEVNKITGKYDLTSKRIKETAKKYLNILKSPKKTSFDFTAFNRRNGSKISRRRFSKDLRLMVNHGVVNSTVLNVYIHRIKFNGIQFAETSRVPSSSMTSNLRKHIYSLLFKNTNEDVYITEYIRNNEVLEPFPVLVKHKDLIVRDFNDKEDTLQYLYKVTNCKIPVKITENRFFIIVTDVWINYCCVNTADFLNAIILCYTLLQKEANMELNVEETEFSADLAYCGSCWQDIALELSCLIDLLGRPVDLPRIHKTYDGKLLHYINKEIALCEKEAIDPLAIELGIASVGRLLDTRFGDQVMQLYKSLKEILDQLNVDRLSSSN